MNQRFILFIYASLLSACLHASTAPTVIASSSPAAAEHTEVIEDLPKAQVLVVQKSPVNSQATKTVPKQEVKKDLTPPEDRPGAPRIPTKEEREAKDPDPNNTAAFPKNGGGIVKPEKITIPKDDGTYKELTPEERAKKIQALEAGKQAKMTAAIKEEAVKTKEAKKEQNLFEMNLKGMQEAGVNINKSGVACSGQLNIWNDKYLRLTFAATTAGILAQAYMTELKLGPIKISGTGPDGKYGTDDDGVLIELKINKKKQRVMLSGMIDLFLSMVRADIISGTQGFTLFATMRLLAFQAKVLAETNGSGPDIDFNFKGAADSDFVKFIEDIAIKAVEKLTQFTSEGIKKFQKQVDKLKAVIKEMKKVQKELRKQFSQAEKRYKQKTKHGEKVIAPLRQTVRKLESAIGKLKSQIWKIRKKLTAGRRKTLSDIRKAQRKVNSLKDEVKTAQLKFKQAKRKTKWYKPWTYAVAAYWGIRVAAVEIARWSAEKVLQGLMTIIDIFPIDSIPPLPILWASYGSTYIALKAAHSSLSAAIMATNPLAMKEMGEMIGLGIAITANQASILGVQSQLITAQASLSAARRAVETAGSVTAFAMKAAASTINILNPVRFTGASVMFSSREVQRGKLPQIGIIGRIFGKRKNILLSIDLNKPETFVTSFTKGFLSALDPNYRGPNIIDEIEASRLDYKDELDRIANEKVAIIKKENEWKAREKERNAEIERLKSENKLREDSVAELNDIKKGSGEFGKNLDINKEIADKFDPNNPTKYTAVKRQNNFRWFDKWQLATKNSGTIVFHAEATSEIQVGFQSTIQADSKNKLFDVIIGGNNNSGSMIRDDKDNILIQSNDPAACIVNKKPGISDLQPYWISYHEGYIACGKGEKPGENLIIEWQMATPPANVQFYSFSSHNNRVVYENIGNAPTFSRPFGTQYSVYGGVNTFKWPAALTLPTKDAGTILFKAKAARDIVVGLTNDPSKNFARYLASLGMEGNKLSSLTKVTEDGKNYNRVSMSQDKDVLVQGAGKDYKQYWLTYNKGHFAIGSGSNPVENLLLEYLDRDPVPDITHLSFSSWDNSVEIRDIQIQQAAAIKAGSKYSAVNRASTFEWREEWLLAQAGKGTITWEAKGSRDMIIGLHTKQDKDPKACTYQIVIGGNNNSITQLRDATGTVLAQTTDPDAMIRERNNYNQYWLSYDMQNYALILGIGKEPGKKVVLEYSGVSAPISHFSFSNNTGFIEYQRITSIPLVPTKLGRQFSATNRNGTFVWRPEWQLPTPGKGVIVFRAKAAQDIVIGLHTNKAKNKKESTYTLLIGSNKNRQSMIRSADGTTLASNEDQSAHIIDAHNFYTYWIAYDQEAQTLAAGHGALPGKDIIIEAKLPQALSITHYSLSSLNSTVQYKQIAAYKADSEELAERARADTANFISVAQQRIAYPWRDEWQLSQKDSGAILFSARGANNICIGLHTSAKDQPTKTSYEVIIGDHNNTQTVIRDKQGRVQAISADPDALIPDDGNYYNYWLNYHKGHISIGRGNTPGQKVILEWADIKPIKNITHFAFTNLASPVSFRDIKRGSVGRQPLNSTYSAWQRHGKFIWYPQWAFAQQDKSAIVFQAKADKDIIVAIGRSPQSGPTYLVTIGANNNKATVISKGRPVQTITGSNASIPSKKVYRPYWVMYHRGYLALGHGDEPGKQMIAEWQDPSPMYVMNNFSFSGSNNQVSYKQIASKPVSRESFIRFSSYVAVGQNKTYSYRNEWQLPKDDEGSITFTARAKANVRVALHNAAASKTDQYSFEVVFGGKNNTETFIKDSNGTIVARTDNPQATILFADEPNEYWVSYKNGHISAGTGNDPTTGLILSHKARKTERGIRYFSFSSNQNETIKYGKIKSVPYAKASKSVSYTAHKKKGKYNVNSKWKLPNTKSSTVLVQARAKKEVMIGLFKDIGSIPTYEVIIGAHNNTATVLRKNGAEVARSTAETAVINNELIDYTYWLSAHNGVVSVGRGDKPGKERILVWQDPEADTQVSFYGLTSNDQTITYKKMETTTGVELTRDSFFTAHQQKGVMTWRNTWRIKKDKTTVLNANMPHADIYIGLRATNNGKALYTIRLGGWQNTKCVIMRGSKIVAEIDKTINLGKKKVWFTCIYDEKTRQNRIIVGTGIPGNKVLLDWTDDKPSYRLRAFGLSSGQTEVEYRKIGYTDLVIPEPKPIGMVAPDADETAEQTVAAAEQVVKESTEVKEAMQPTQTVATAA